MAPRPPTTLSLLVAAGAAGCQSRSPASSRGVERTAATATEWLGERGGASAPGSPPAAPAAVPKDTWVLHVGDSFVHASLQQNLGPQFRATGSSYVVDATTATYTTTWANDSGLDRWLARRPSLVLVTLGANEVDMPAPSEHAGAVERLAHKIGTAGAACVWMTPPMWKRDSGILLVIHDHCAPCLFFDSDAVLGGLGDDERQRDRIHPNERGGARWSAAFWGWLGEHRDPARPGWSLVPFEVRGS